MIKQYDVVCLSRKRQLVDMSLAVDHGGDTIHKTDYERVEKNLYVKTVERSEYDCAMWLPGGEPLPDRLWRECQDQPPGKEGTFVARVEVEVRKSGIWQIGSISWVPLADMAGVFFAMREGEAVAQ